MTFSIVARSADGESWGIAVASKFIAVGSAVPAAEAGAGAIATQALANTTYKTAAIEHLRGGASAEETLERLIDGDDGRNERQVGMVDREGRAVSYTGTGCLEWAGGLTGDGYAIQGNILESEEVVKAMEAGFLASDTSAPLANRLMAALAAGEAAGGDARGKQSAALLVVKDGAGFLGFDDIDVELRVEDHVDPIPELLRLLEMYQHIRRGVGIPEDERTQDTPELMAEMDARAESLGQRNFVIWMCRNNYEMYGGEDWTATRVVEELRAATPDWKPDA